jgi:alpha-ribazole phosphatase
MRIIFVRHGVTQANKDRTFSKPDTPLAEDGYEVLDRTKELLAKYHIDNVYTSDLLRTKQSADYLGYKNYIADPRINEIDVGDFKGHSYDFVLNHYGKEMVSLKEDKMAAKYPNGESRLDVIERVSEFLDQIKDQEGNILCLSHGIAIRSALFWIIKDLGSYENFWIDNGSVTVFRIEDDKKIIECVNAI